MGDPPLELGVAIVARTLRVDALTSEVVSALQVEGVEPVLIKGPVVAELVYDEGEPRDYVDADLLVEPRRYEDAERVLGGLGFVRAKPPQTARRLRHGDDWWRADGAHVDLHRTLPGVRHLNPDATWRCVREHLSAPRRLANGVEVATPDDPMRALIVALHVTHHVPHRHLKDAAAVDLERAITRVPFETWREAAALAERLHATLDLSHGLVEVPGGAALAARLGLPPASSGELATAGLERILAAHGLGAQLRIIARAVVPSPSHLRWVSPLARRGRLGLAAAYLERPLRVLRMVRPAIGAWGRGRRAP